MTTFNKFDRCGTYSGLPLHARKEDTVSLLEKQKKHIKMTKTRTAILLVLIIVVFALVFSPSDAYPTVEPTASNDYHLNNGSRLVITNVIKTVEFEVGVVDDDDNVTDNNMAAFNNSGLYETDIQLLNVDLLKELVDRATEETKAEDVVETAEETLSTAART